MELHQLRYFCAVADSGSFSRAAEQSHVSQPSLSQQILKLEDELGARLFDRLGRSVRLTDVGKAFLPRARAVLREIGEDADEGQTKFLGTGLEMAALARHVSPGKTVRRVRDFGPHIGVGRDGKLPAEAYDPAPGIVRQLVDVGDDPSISLAFGEHNGLSDQSW